LISPSEKHDAKTLPDVKGQSFVGLTQELLTSLRNDLDFQGHLQRLANIPKRDFLEAIHSDAMKKAFWINAYNCFNLLGMKRKLPFSNMEKWKHFSTLNYQVAGISLSLNAIEHGILRRSQFWWARGWIRRPFPSREHRRLQLASDDPRLHFALNCGANGCPAIRYYHSESVQQELELATAAFLGTEVASENEEIWVSQIFRMYLGDFGGMTGLRRFLKQYRSDLEFEGKTIRFRKYDWSFNLEKFAECPRT
jgi:hypothetical protein